MCRCDVLLLISGLLYVSMLCMPFSVSASTKISMQLHKTNSYLCPEPLTVPHQSQADPKALQARVLQYYDSSYSYVTLGYMYLLLCSNVVGMYVICIILHNYVYQHFHIRQCQY